MKTNNKKTVLILSIAFFVFIIGAIITFVCNKNSSIMGNSVTNYYCEDSSFSLVGTTCVKEEKEKVLILGDLNYDNAINSADIDIMNSYIDKLFDSEDVEFKEEELLVADLNKSGEIDYVDLDILKAYVSGYDSYNTLKTLVSNVGVEKLCKNGYKLEGDFCTRTIKKQALLSSKVNDNTDNKAKLKITYNANQGFGTMEEQYTIVGSKDRFKKNVFTKNGYQFAGWHVYNANSSKWLCYIDSTKSKYDFVDTKECNNNGYLVYNDEEIIPDFIKSNSEVVMYAQWNNKFTIKYNANGGTGVMQDQDVTYGTQVQIAKNLFSKSGYAFDGWRVYNEAKKQWACYTNESKTLKGYTVDANCNKYGYVIYKDENIVSKTAEPGESIIMYAQWNNKFKVKYSANGGTGLMQNQEITYGISTKILTNKFKRKGYAFIGWLVYNNSKEQYACFNNNKKSMYTKDTSICEKNGYVIYHNNASIAKTAEPGENITMYAQWLKISDDMQPTVVEDMNLGYSSLTKFTYTKNLQDIDVDSSGNFYISQDLNDGYKVHRMIISKVDKNGNKSSNPYLNPYPQLGHGNFEIYNGYLYTACDSDTTYQSDKYVNGKKTTNYNGAHLLCRVNINRANKNNPKNDSKININYNNGFDVIYKNSKKENYYYNSFNNTLEFIKIDSKDGKTAVVRTSKGNTQYFKIYELENGKIKKKKGQFTISYKTHIYNNNKVTMQSFDIYDNKIYLLYGSGSFAETNYNSIAYIDVYDFSSAIGYNNNYYNLNTRKSCNKLVDTGVSSKERIFDKKGFFFEAEGITVRNDNVYLGFASVNNTKNIYGENKYVSIYKIDRKKLDKGSNGC